MTGDKRQSGFSIVEMIVAVGLFAIVSVIIAQLFSTFTRTQQRAGVNQKIQSDARVMFAQISDRIRTGTIDYAAYAGDIPRPTQTLNIIDENGVATVIRQSNTESDCPTPESTPCLVLSEDGGTTFYPMTTENFTVDNLSFYIAPETNPENTSTTTQPRVTYSISLKNSSRDQALEALTFVQTTVSSRVYSE